MATNYQGRRAPNVSQYIQNLNTIPSAADMAAQQEFANFDDDLALFTNTEFFDFDINAPVPDMSSAIQFAGEQQRSGQADGAKNIGFVNQTNFVPNPYGEFPQFPQQPQAINHVSPRSLPPSPPNGAFNIAQSRPTIPGPAAFHALTGPNTGEKRKSTSVSLASPADFEEASRHAAEEDKRRRNTAASARFRVKKKQREQALEKSAKEMSDKVAVLEARVGQLEMENQWLKGLITEKNMGRMPEMPVMTAPPAKRQKPTPSEEEAATVNRDADEEDDEQFEEEGEEVKAEGERSTEARKDGVGTGAEAVTA